MRELEILVFNIEKVRAYDLILRLIVMIEFIADVAFLRGKGLFMIKSLYLVVSLDVKAWRNIRCFGIYYVTRLIEILYA